MYGGDLDELFELIGRNGYSYSKNGYQFLTNLYKDNQVIRARDCLFIQWLINQLSDRPINRIAVIGHQYPIAIIYKLFQRYQSATIITSANSCSFGVQADYIQRLFGGQLLIVDNKNPIWVDPNSFCDNIDLYVYPETEYMVPFSILPYSLKGLIGACNMKSQFTPLVTNLATDIDHMLELVDYQQVIGSHYMTIGAGRDLRRAFMSLGIR